MKILRKKELEPAILFLKHPGHLFSRKTLMYAPANIIVRKIMEASTITLNRPTLKEEVESHRLFLFRNGVT